MIRTLVALLAVVSLSAALTAPVSAQAAPAAAATPSGPAVNINTADAAGLAALPGIGPKTADLIIAYRQKNGPFKKIEELMNVHGIGEKSFLKIRAQLSVSDPKANGQPRQ
jgi:competence protein ComEA